MTKLRTIGVRKNITEIRFQSNMISSREIFEVGGVRSVATHKYAEYEVVKSS